jgi:hypothetical protein
MRNSKLVATKVGIAASMLGMVVALSGITSGFAAGSDAPEAEALPAGSPTTSASVAVPPWCGWNINPVVGSITLTPPLVGGVAAKYLGEDLELTGSTSSVNAYVGATGSAEAELASDNCSWFGKTPLAATFAVSIAEGDAAFTAASESRPDAGMGWLLSTKPLVIANTFSAGCTTAGFTSNPGASMTASGATTAWSIASATVSTNDFCNYSVEYTATVPGGKEPTYGNSTYVFTGPELIHTLTTS